jgi:hypothetical protein
MKRTRKPTKDPRSASRRERLSDRLSSLVSELGAAESGSKTVSGSHTVSEMQEMPTAEAMERFCNIPLIEDSAVSGSACSGAVVFDSWQDLPAHALRDITDGHIRRLTIKAGSLRLELVAERREQKWEFVARIYSSDKVRHDCLIKAGGRKLLPGSGGFYHWTSKNKPRLVELHTFDQQHVVEGLTW